MLHTMGFRNLHLFGFECSLEKEPTDDMKKETTGADDEPKRPKYFQVSVDNKAYWTTGELLAMAQDCEKTFADKTMGINYNFYGYLNNYLKSSFFFFYTISFLKNHH